MKTGKQLSQDIFNIVVQHAPLVSIDLVIRDPEGTVLVGLRNNAPARGFWFVPGGVIFKNETLDHAFHRILRGETGLDMARAQARHMGLFEHFYDTNRHGVLGFGTHYVVNAYELEMPARPTIRGDDQHGEMRWISPETLLADATVHDNTKAYLR